jgi:hypothetical protein
MARKKVSGPPSVLASPITRPDHRLRKNIDALMGRAA